MHVSLISAALWQTSYNNSWLNKSSAAFNLHHHGEHLKPEPLLFQNNDIYVCRLWAVECNLLMVLKLFAVVVVVVFFRLNAHETALLISAALMIVSLNPHQWTLKNKLSKHTTFIPFKWSPVEPTKRLCSPLNAPTRNHQNNSII